MVGKERTAQLSSSELARMRQRIIELEDAESRRWQAEELFRSLATSSPIGIYIVQDKVFRFVNPQFQKNTGYSEDELLGMPTERLVVPEDWHTVRENAVKMLKGGLAAPYEYRTVTKGGETRWILETVASIRYRGERATVGNYVDVTERKIMQEQLILADRLASIGELASGIAHELNNPLTGVIGYAHLVLQEDLPSEIRGKVETMRREAERAIQVVKNLLTFARKHSPARQPVNINSVITKVLEMRAYEHRLNNILVRPCLTGDLPEILADYFQLQQVFINIIINAEYFMIERRTTGDS